MSRAFVKESDDQWLHEIAPTLKALINFLTIENNGIRVYEKLSSLHPESGKQVYEMSNGNSYSVNDESQWYVVIDITEN